MKSLLGALLVLCSVSAGLARTALAVETKDSGKAEAALKRVGTSCKECHDAHK